MMKLKLVTSVAAITLVTSVLPTSAVAQGLENSVVSPISQEKSLRASKLLDKKDILKIVQTNIQGYLKNDEQTRGKEIVASEDFINLYDLENNLFAYMVPLLDNGDDIGYITVGAIEDGYASYEIFIKNGVVNDIKGKLKAKAKAKANESAQLVFMYPSSYVIKVTDGSNDRYFDTKAAVETDVSDKIKSMKGKLEDNYKKIRTMEHKTHIDKIIQYSKIQPGDYSVTVATEDVRLVKEAIGSFVPVSTGDSFNYPPNGIAYGGDQIWYGSTFRQERGCGPVAAANITKYLAQANPTKYGKLYAPSTMNKADFVTHMDALYDQMVPGLLGEISGSDFTADVETFASKRGVKLTRMTSSAAFTLDNTATYIKNGLNANSPVSTLNTETDYQYKWHWMTITKYFRDSVENRWIAVSTWGERRSIDYRVHFDAMLDGWLDGGLMWFY